MYLKRKKSAEKIHFQSGPPGLDDVRRAEIQEQILRYRENMAVSIFVNYLAMVST